MGHTLTHVSYSTTFSTEDGSFQEMTFFLSLIDHSLCFATLSRYLFQLLNLADFYVYEVGEKNSNAAGSHIHAPNL